MALSAATSTSVRQGHQSFAAQDANAQIVYPGAPYPDPTTPYLVPPAVVAPAPVPPIVVGPGPYGAAYITEFTPCRGREPLHGKMVHVRTEWAALVLDAVDETNRLTC